MLHVGAIAPDFTLTDEQGHPVTLSSFRGNHPVVLIFYPGDQTPICTTQLCGIRDGYDAFEAVGAIILGINPASEFSHRKFSRRYNFPFPLLVDRERSVAKAYDVLLMNLGPFSVINRMVYVVGTDGTIIFAERGLPDNQTIINAISGAAPAGP